jgi:hypothetical protein
MDKYEYYKHHHQFNKTGTNHLLAPDSTVAIYTVLTILLRMRNALGLEAMLEYIATYCSIIEKNNPRFKMAVKQALTLISIEKLYRDAISGEKSNNSY